MEKLKKQRKYRNFHPKEISELPETAEQHKSIGNNLFSKQNYETIEQYEKALDTCPN